MPIFLENESGLPRFLERRKENKHFVYSSFLSLKLLRFMYSPSGVESSTNFVVEENADSEVFLSLKPTSRVVMSLEENVLTCFLAVVA